MDVDAYSDVGCLLDVSCEVVRNRYPPSSPIVRPNVTNEMHLSPYRLIYLFQPTLDHNCNTYFTAYVVTSTSTETAVSTPMQTTDYNGPAAFAPTSALI